MWGRVHMYIRLPGRKILITPERPLHKKWIKDFFSKCDQTADLVTFTEEILNGKRHVPGSGHRVFS